MVIKSFHLCVMGQKFSSTHQVGRLNFLKDNQDFAIQVHPREAAHIYTKSLSFSSAKFLSPLAMHDKKNYVETIRTICRKKQTNFINIMKLFIPE